MTQESVREWSMRLIPQQHALRDSISSPAAAGTAPLDWLWRAKQAMAGELAEELWLYPHLTSAAEAGWLNKLQERERVLILLSTGGNYDKELADKATATRIVIQV